MIDWASFSVGWGTGIFTAAFMAISLFAWSRRGTPPADPQYEDGE
jgi:hypothetical protein